MKRLRKWSGHLTGLLTTRLNVRLILIFIICFAGASLAFMLIAAQNPLWSQVRDSDRKADQLHQIVSEVGMALEKQSLAPENRSAIVQIVSPYQRAHPNIKLLVADETGHAVFRTANTQQLDVRALLRRELGFSSAENTAEKQLTAIYPVSFPDGVGYVLTLLPHQALDISPTQYNHIAFLTIAGSIAAFLLLFFLFMRPITHYIEEIESGIRKIVHKDWNHRLRVKGRDELSSLASNINWMALQLKERFEKERSLEQAKNELITNVSHDLRTPLTSIIGYIRLLRDGKYQNGQELQRHLQTTYNMATKLQQLIQELFEYTKLASPDVQMEYENMNLGALLQQFIGEYTPMLESSGLQVQMALTDEPLLVQMDTEKFVRVLDNLLSNAEKYSYKPSRLSIQLQRLHDEAHLSLTNETDHIPAESLPKLFQRLYRLDTARSGRIEGSGIGLAAAKRIVELHRGRIWAESRQDDLTIHIALPLQHS